MADPLTMMAGVSLGGSALGGITSMFGISQKAGAEAQMYGYKAAVAQANAAVAETNKKLTLEEGAVQEQIVGLRGAQEMGALKTAQAAGGLRLDTGTQADVRKSQFAQIKEDEALTDYQAQKKAYGFAVEAANFQNEAQMDTMAAANVKKAATFDMASSILGGATGVADKWVKFSQAGIF